MNVSHALAHQFTFFAPVSVPKTIKEKRKERKEDIKRKERSGKLINEKKKGEQTPLNTSSSFFFLCI